MYLSGTVLNTLHVISSFHPHQLKAANNLGSSVPGMWGLAMVTQSILQLCKVNTFHPRFTDGESEAHRGSKLASKVKTGTQAVRGPSVWAHDQRDSPVSYNACVSLSIAPAFSKHAREAIVMSKGMKS